MASGAGEPGVEAVHSVLAVDWEENFVGISVKM